MLAGSKEPCVAGTKQDNSTDVQETWLKVQVWPSHSKLNLFLTNWMSISSPLYSLDSLETSSNQWNHIKTTFQHAAALTVLDICTWLIVHVFYVFEEQMITNSSIRTQKHS